MKVGVCFGLGAWLADSMGSGFGRYKSVLTRHEECQGL